MTLKERIKSLLTAANQTTGKSDTDLTAGVQSLIDGFGGGGGDIENQLVQRSDSLVKYSNREITVVGEYGFAGFSTLRNVDIPNVRELKEYAFYSSGLLEAVFPKVDTAERRSFYLCDDLVIIKLPMLNGEVPETLQMKSLEIIDIGDFGNSAPNIEFYYYHTDCPKLSTIILRSNHVIKSYGASIFKGSPVSDGNGFFYVPKSLVDEYKVATNWVALADHIRAIEDYPEITGG